MASGQEVRYVVYVDGMGRVVSGFQQGEAAATSMERSIAGVNSSLRELGIAIGAYQLFDIGKNMVENAADFEMAMLRIKNASDNAGVGMRNQFFIKHEVDDFKLNLSDATDAYGKFLFKIKNAHISSDAKNSLFTEILGVSKVAGLTMEQMSGAIYQTAALLGEGVLVGRNLRQLAMIHPNLMPYIADQLGIKDKERSKFSDIVLHENPDKAKDETALQILSQSISHGLTKMGISSTDVMINAWDKYYESIKDKVPETLTLIQSGINTISSAWTEFDSTLIQRLKPELSDFFDDIKDGILWMEAHEDFLISFGKTMKDLAEVWIAFKVANGALNFSGFAANLLSGAGGGSALIGEGLIATVSSVLGAAAVIAAIGFVVDEVGTSKGWWGTTQRHGNKSIGDDFGMTDWSDSAESLYQNLQKFGGNDNPGRIKAVLQDEHNAKLYKELAEAANDYGSMDDIQFDTKGNIINRFKFLADQEKQHVEFMQFLGDQWEEMPIISGLPTLGLHNKPNSFFPYKSQADKDKAMSAHSVDIAAPKDKITGNHPVTYNYYIHEMNGQKFDKQVINKGGDIDIQDIGNKVAQVLESVTYNSQQGGN